MNSLTLVPINMHADEGDTTGRAPELSELINQHRAFYTKVGFEEPWIGYLANIDGKYVGACGFKGKPRDGKVELAYQVFPEYRKQGIGTMVCRELVQMALKTDAGVRITARTLPVNNPSTRILSRNGFDFSGMVRDGDDGDVWEWEYDKNFTPEK